MAGGAREEGDVPGYGRTWARIAGVPRRYHVREIPPLSFRLPCLFIYLFVPNFLLKILLGNDLIANSKLDGYFKGLIGL